MYGTFRPGDTRPFSIVIVALLIACFACFACFACARERQGSRADTQRPPAVGKAAVPLRMSEEGLRRVRGDEAFIGRVYDDGVGNQTIGYGHMLRPGESFPGSITEQRARELLRADVERVVNPALDRVTAPLTQNQVDALGSFIFNVGPGNFTRFVLPHLNSGDFHRALDHMGDFVRGKNQRTGELITLRGLQRRRQDEMKLFQES